MQLYHRKTSVTINKHAIFCKYIYICQCFLKNIVKLNLSQSNGYAMSVAMQCQWLCNVCGYVKSFIVTGVYICYMPLQPSFLNPLLKVTAYECDVSLSLSLQRQETSCLVLVPLSSTSQLTYSMCLPVRVNLQVCKIRDQWCHFTGD